MILLNTILKLERNSNIPILLLVYLVYLFIFTLAPFTFSIDPQLSLASLYNEKFDTRSVFWRIPLWDLITNILLFVPFGFLFVSLPVAPQSSRMSRLFLAGGAVCALSLSIEICQLFLPRAPSMVDIFLNVVGGLAGAFIAIYARVPLSRIVQQWWVNIQKTPILALLLTAYILGLLATYGVPLPLRPDFSNWDPNFTFQLGNEATLDRPWLGRIFLLAMYDRALSQDQIANNFTAGTFSDSAQSRVTEGLVAFYNFTEGSGPIIHDRSSFGLPLDLKIRNLQNIRWLRPNGIEFLKNTIIAYSEPANKLYNSDIYRRNALTIETWIAPADVHQDGPARIVSYSRDPKSRNFTLGQVEQNVVFRLRTPMSGLNGNSPQLQTRDNPLTTGLQHLVITYRKGFETLYVNGQQHEILVLDEKKYLIEVFEEFFGWKYMWGLLVFSFISSGISFLPFFLKKQKTFRKSCLSVYLHGHNYFSSP